MAGSKRPEESIMKWRALLLSGFFAASIGLGYVSTASADPPPWAGRWQHNKHYNGGSGDHWKHDDWSRDAWRHDHSRDSAAWRYRHDDDYWRQRRQDWRWRREQGRYYPPNDGRYGSVYGYPGSAYGYPGSIYGYPAANSYSSSCNARIARDQSKIDEFNATGRHHKARQWFEKDMQNAMRSGC
jgi:hypothetical protein